MVDTFRFYDSPPETVTSFQEIFFIFPVLVVVATPSVPFELPELPKKSNDPPTG
jgi:hypothetical protein